MKIKPCVIGLGYVGLPVLVNLSKKYNPCGFDINKNRILNLKKNLDKTKEFTKKELTILRNAKLTFKFNELKKCNFFIVCVPTPININKHPDLRPLKIACKIIGKTIKKNDIIVFESTVYPGTTRDICVPIIETYSKLSISKKEFFVCYSPERVNPGDKKHSLKRINKIIAIPEKKILKDIKKVYQHLSKKLIITKKIEETETAKVIENIQRDINIALANEIYIFCKKLNLNFKEVLKLAASKWNFIKFSPGLVGGHCLPVDPYYFSYVAKKNNMKTNITLAGRNTNEYMKYFVINEIKKELKKNNFVLNKDRVIFAGLSYKKNVSDMRNSQSVKIFNYFKKMNKNIYGIDPFVEKNLKEKIIDKNTLKKMRNIKCIIKLVDHEEFKYYKVFNKVKIIKLF